jgi:PAS domain S-box-containing protein
MMLPAPPRIKVLYVDDEEGNLKAFKATFRRDFDVHLAASASDALELLDREPIHVVVSDQRMPRCTGTEFLAQVRERHPRAIRMLLTGYADLEAVIDAVNKGGIYSYTTKPWDPTDLKLRIQQAYEVHALRSEREDLFNRYRQVFEASGDPIVLFQEDGRVLEANPAAERLIGLPREQVLQARITDWIEHSHLLFRAMRERRRGRSFANVDLTLNTPLGHVIDCLMTATYLGRTPDGQALFQAMIKDISDRKQEEQRLVKLNTDLDRRVKARTQQLMEALADLGSFSYTVAHDLRSPLKNIKVLSEHLQEMGTDPDQSQLAERIHKGSSRLIELVDDLLRFSQTNTSELKREDFDLRSMAEECIQEQVPPGSPVHVELRMNADSVVPGDRAMLKVALTNLLSNAIKFSRKSNAPSIEIGHRDTGDDHVIWVKDNGVGFDSSRADQVFGVFKRLHRNDQFEGSGVGLAIVQRVLHKHGGSCWAESRPGEGATLYIKVPKQAQQLQQLPFAS